MYVRVRLCSVYLNTPCLSCYLCHFKSYVRILSSLLFVSPKHSVFQNPNSFSISTFTSIFVRLSWPVNGWALGLKQSFTLSTNQAHRFALHGTTLWPDAQLLLSQGVQMNAGLYGSIPWEDWTDSSLVPCKIHLNLHATGTAKALPLKSFTWTYFLSVYLLRC